MFILIFLKYFPTGAPVSNDQLTAELIALEQHRCASMVKADIAALQNTLHDQLVYVHSSGVRDRKTSYLNKLSDRKMRYDTLQFTELHVTARYRGGPLCHPHRAHAGQHLPWRQACRAHLTLHGGVGAGAGALASACNPEQCGGLSRVGSCCQWCWHPVRSNPRPLT